MFDDLPTAKLAHLPTPLEELPTLSRKFGPNLLIKRDDCTGLATGGNKTRIIEFLLGDALAKDCDTLITGGGIKSNHCRQTAAAARKYGLKPVLVLFGEQPEEINGNFLLDHLFGADIRIFQGEERTKKLHTVAKNLKEKGHNPYVMTFGGSQPLGIAGYAKAFKETMQQADSRNIDIDRMIVTTGGGGTQAGLIIGKEMLGRDTEIIGMSISRQAEEVTNKIATLLENTIQKFDLDIDPIPPKTIHVKDEYIGEGYGQPTPEMVQTVKLLARKEGILLDPVYTGKGFSGLLDLMEKEEITEDETVVFIHTGGTPMLFNPNYRNLFLEKE